MNRMTRIALPVLLERFRLSPKREKAPALCSHAIPDAKPLRTFAGIAPAACAAFPAMAMDDRLVRQFQALDPDTRLEQRCDTEAMERINKAGGAYRPDKVIAYTFADPVLGKNDIKAVGAVFRSKGEWYRLKYRCATGPDHIEVLSFRYEIGAMVPHEAWDTHYLYP